jgi:hypothetical protein
MEMPIGAFSRIVFRVCSLASAARARWDISLAAAASCELGVAPLGRVAKHDHGSLDRPAGLGDRSRAVFDGELAAIARPQQGMVGKSADPAVGNDTGDGSGAGRTRASSIASNTSSSGLPNASCCVPSGQRFRTGLSMTMRLCGSVQ